MDAGFAKRLVNTGLVSAERAAALQHQGDNFKGKTLCGSCNVGLDLNIHDSPSIACRRNASVPPIRMPTAISIAKIARTIPMISSIAVALVFDAHLT